MIGQIGVETNLDGSLENFREMELQTVSSKEPDWVGKEQNRKGSKEFVMTNLCIGSEGLRISKGG